MATASAASNASLKFSVPLLIQLTPVAVRKEKSFLTLALSINIPLALTSAAKGVVFALGKHTDGKYYHEKRIS